MRTAVLAAALLGTVLPAQVPLGDLIPGPVGFITPRIVAVGPRVLITAASGGPIAVDVWTTDGTAAGTTRLRAAVGGASLRFTLGGQLFRLRDGVVLLFADDGTGPALWRTDGTAVGTHVVSRAAGAGIGIGATFHGDTTFDGFVHFVETTPSGINRLWRSDGTPGGTTTFGTTTNAIDQTLATPLGVYFEETDFSIFAGRLRFWDGTTLRTVLPSTSGGYEVLGAAGDGLYVRTDATNALTVVHGATTTALPGVPGQPLTVTPLDDGRTAITTLVNFSRSEVWVTDDSPGGTTRLTAIPAGGIVGTPFALRGALWFPVFLGGQRTELWRSDGTTPGTAPIWSSTAGEFVTSFTPLGRHHLLLAADLGADGEEPWLLDLRTTTVTQIADLNPGPSPSWPEAFTAALELDGEPGVVFIATDGTNGPEPWGLDLASPGVEAAAFAAVRAPCRAVSQPSLAVDGDPVVGDASFAFRVDGATPNAVAVGLFGAAVLPFGTGPEPCLPIDRPVGLSAIVPAGGTVTWPVPLPNDPSLVGARLWAQAAVAVPGGAVFGTFDTTATHVVVVGS